MNLLKTGKKAVMMMVVLVCMLSCAACATTSKKTKISEFPEFQGTDFEGNAVDETLFAANQATVVNFWYNECSACVDEMQALDALNQKLKEKGVELVGINVEAGNHEEILRSAKQILKDQNATFRNLVISDGDAAKKYMSGIVVFPTTIVVDSEGKMVGSPIEGNIDNESNMKKLERLISEVCE